MSSPSGTVISITEPADTTCFYLIEMRHKAACKGGKSGGGAVGGLSGGSILLIMYVLVTTRVPSLHE
jgi:hypothetical protein